MSQPARIFTTFFASKGSPKGERGATTWPALVEILAGARPTRRFGRLPVEVAKKDEAPGFSLATFTNDYRLLANVERVFAVGIDLDKFGALPIKMTRRPGQIIPAPTWADVTARFDKVESFAHTTYSSTEESPRVRVFLRLDRPVTGEEYRRVYAYCADMIEGYGFLVDRSASDPSRFWYLPSTPPGKSVCDEHTDCQETPELGRVCAALTQPRYRYSIGRGRLVRADVALATIPAVALAPVAPPRVSPAPNASADDADRAAKYLEHCDPAISGQDGHKQTFSVCQKIVRGFALDEDTAYQILTRWNASCQPPWSERELRRKVREAAQRGSMPWGELRDRERAA